MSIQKIFITPDGKNHFMTFLLLTGLFLVLGFSTGLIDVLNKHFQSVLQISKAESALVQFSNYIAYFIFAIPAGIFAEKYGYKKGIFAGLTIIAIGAFSFIFSLKINTFFAFLCSLFILATGLTCIETMANPYATFLGSAKAGAARLNIAQSVTGIGLIFGPLIGGYFVLSNGGTVVSTNNNLIIPYIGIGIIVLLLAALFFFKNIPDFAPVKTKQENGIEEEIPLWKKPHFIFAVVAQFLYVAAQTGIFSFFINYVVEHSPIFTETIAIFLPANWCWNSPAGWKFSEIGASQLLAFGGFGLFMIGRFSGGILESKYKSSKLLAIFSIVNALLMVLIVITDNGWMGISALIISFYFMSIMYPTIFALGIFGLKTQTKRASSYIVMAIVGGAVVPILMGKMADIWSMSVGFIVPCICFIVIAIYALRWNKLVEYNNL
ncbi:MFS transporter [Pectinatus sottacetonis]|uniref:MFS transporter n=1 Tax=Pectinatus sottacetonis TaxID=1002795 RepID=UPI0018C4F1E6|nr:MFS transporter [Pectinatus sottacetonis]